MYGRSLWRHAIVVGSLVAAAAIVRASPPVAQDPAYHQMADRRPMLGIPNCLNVLSNFPFAVVAALGLAALFREGGNRVPDQWARWPYAVLFIGTALTTVGSAYYHLAPDNDRLLWDRLPMTVGFVGLLTAVVSERISPRLAQRIVGPLLATGLGSVVWWHWTELRGHGDLRAYVLLRTDRSQPSCCSCSFIGRTTGGQRTWSLRLSVNRASAEYEVCSSRGWPPSLAASQIPSAKRG